MAFSQPATQVPKRQGDNKQGGKKGLPANCHGADADRLYSCWLLEYLGDSETLNKEWLREPE